MEGNDVQKDGSRNIKSFCNAIGNENVFAFSFKELGRKWGSQDVTKCEISQV